MTSEYTTESSNHPKVDEASGLTEKGSMSRREFVRIASLLGVSA